MKKMFLLFPVLLPLFIKSQANFELQAGGSNFLGATFNTATDISISKDKQHFITPGIGVGILAPQWAQSTMIVHSRLGYRYKRIGFGVETSGFTANPFSRARYLHDFVDLIVYPSFNYTFDMGRSNWYCRASTGLYFAFSRYYDYGSGGKLQFEGDVIPGAGLSIGYHLCRAGG